ncbi:hypothetical protein CRENBAI_012562, partial [Crenichthys baileyi]
TSSGANTENNSLGEHLVSKKNKTQGQMKVQENKVQKANDKGEGSPEAGGEGAGGPEAGDEGADDPETGDEGADGLEAGRSE